MLYATVRQRKIHVKNPAMVIRNGIGVDKLVLDMDDEWKEMSSIVSVFTLHYTVEEEQTVTEKDENGKEQEVTKTVTVSKEKTAELTHRFGEELLVPWECLTETGTLSVSCTGYVGGEKIMTTMKPDSFWQVVENGPMKGDTPMEPTPTLYEQVVAAAGAANTAAAYANNVALDLQTARESGEFDGVSPTVSVGSVRASSPGGDPEVTNSGTSTNVILDFTLPRGKQGEQGKRGEPGVSPTVSVQKTEGKVILNITDVNGTQTAEIPDNSVFAEAAAAYASKTPYVSGQFGIAAYSSEEPSLTDRVLAADCGLYTVYSSRWLTNKGNPPSPLNEGKEPGEGTAFRGLANLTNNSSQGASPDTGEEQKQYGWLLVMDEDGNLFSQYLAQGEGRGWNPVLMKNSLPDIVQEVIKALPVYEGGVV